MSKLTTESRKHIAAKNFAGPDRTFPIEDKAHARNAKARASMSYNEDHISEAEKERIDHKADRKLHGEGGMKEHEKPEWKK